MPEKMQKNVHPDAAIEIEVQKLKKKVKTLSRGENKISDIPTSGVRRGD